MVARLIRWREDRWERMVERYVRGLTRDVARLARSTVPRRSGELRRAHRTEVSTSGGRTVGRVIADTDYAVFVHEGRGPVRARPGGVLGPLPPPYPRFVRRVGPAQGQPWLFDALRRGQPHPVRRR